MILRLILVGLVTSMGFELPSSRDVSTLVESSRAWAYAQPSDRTESGLPVVATEITSDYHSADDDSAFQVAQSNTVADFNAAEPVVEALPLVAEVNDDTTATVEVVEVVGAGLSDGEEMTVAYLLADNSPIVETTTLVASQPEVAPAVIEDPAPADVMEVEVAMVVDSIDEIDATPTRAERLATAVRLTREAAQAWASVIDEPAAAEATVLDPSDAP